MDTLLNRQSRDLTHRNKGAAKLTLVVALMVTLMTVLSQLASAGANPNIQVASNYKVAHKYESTIPVTTNNDVLDAAGGVCQSVTIASLPGPDGVTSLREAICAANNHSGGDSITFNIPGTAVHTINLLSQLPVSTGMVGIDGYTQPGAACNNLSNGTNAAPKIVLVGNNPSNTSGIVLLGGNSLVKGLVLQNFNSAILLQSTGNTIAGNFIGTNATGTSAAPNVSGVRIITANNAVGGGVPCDRNLISGNQNGIFLDTSAANNNSIVNNLIGTNAAGTAALPNSDNGVLMLGASNNTVGGGSSSSVNVIAHNQGANIVVDDVNGAATANTIRNNSIYGSSGLGIDLNDDGVTPNDTGDPDSGPNSLQNFPVITIITGSTIGGRLNSAIATNFAIELYASPSCDPSGNGEGQMYLGFVTLTTNSSGNASFSFTGTPPSGWFVTGTATNLSNNSTSEFGPCFPEPQPSPTATTMPTATTIPNTGVISGRAYLHEATAGNEAPGALVYVCSTSGYCSQAATTNSQGDYLVGSLPPGTYNVTAYPPAGYSLLNDRLTGIVVNNNTISGQDVVFEDPEPPAPDTGIVPDVGNDNIPVVHWDEELTLTTSGCEGGSATYEIRKAGLLLRSGPMVENPAGSFTAIIAPLYPETGDILISINITCPNGETEVEDFNVYIDPSGVVQSFLPNGTAAALPFATVTLYRSDAPAGPFEAVPDGSAQMSPSNRKNPDTTRREGRFGWDVIPGYYKVRANKEGCTKPGDPNQPYVDTNIMEIPPPVFDLVLQLDCGSPSFTDVSTSDYFYDSVTYLAAIGVLSGYGNGAQCPSGVPCFLPYNNVTRGQTAKIVASAAGLIDEIPHTQQTFEDVPASNSFWLFIERMASHGYIGGYPCGGPNEPCGTGNKPYFRWGNNVTRNQLAKIVVLTNQYAPTYPADPSFQDVPASDIFYPYVEAALQNSLIAGYQCGGAGEPCGSTNKPYFRGGANATRGQLSKMVTQAMTAPGQ